MTHGKTGYVCGSIRGLANALLELSSNRSQSEEFGIEGAKSIRAKSSLEDETDLLEEVISGLFKEKQGSLTNRRFQDWVQFIDSVNNGKPACFERETGDLPGIVQT